MNLKDIPESKNFKDDTNPSGMQVIKNMIGQFLYTHGVTKGANGKMFDPNTRAWQPGDTVPVDKSGRRSDIDWDSNKGMVPLLTQPTHQNNDIQARKMGFKDAATATAYYRKQREMRTGPAGGASASSGSLLDQIFAIHPSVLLNGVLDKWNKAEQK